MASSGSRSRALAAKKASVSITMQNQIRPERIYFLRGRYRDISRIKLERICRKRSRPFPISTFHARTAWLCPACRRSGPDDKSERPLFIISSKTRRKKYIKGNGTITCSKKKKRITAEFSPHIFFCISSTKVWI